MILHAYVDVYVLCVCIVVMMVTIQQIYNTGQNDYHLNDILKIKIKSKTEHLK